MQLNNKNKEDLKASVIPLSMIFGTLIGEVFALIFDYDFLWGLIIGNTIGLLVGTCMFAILASK